MSESFPSQQARTKRFTLGVPRSFRVSPDGSRIVFLRTKGGADPVTCLWTLDAATGKERLVADPRAMGVDEENMPPQERARRERVREAHGGIVTYATDRAVEVAVFPLSGRVYSVDLASPDAGPAEGGGAVEVTTHTPALDPRPSPDGRTVAYVCDGVLRVTGLSGKSWDRILADPGAGNEHSKNVTYGLPEFIAGEEMDRTRGYWWSPAGDALLVARVDTTNVQRWYIADPANPASEPAKVAYPSAGTPNADVRLLVTRLNGRQVAVDIDHTAFPYIATVNWQKGHDPLVVVQSRDQRVMRLLSVNQFTGQTELIREDTDPAWLDITLGVPAWTSDSRLAWTEDREGTHRLLVATPEELRDRTAQPVTPPGLQVREVVDVDGGTVLFRASSLEPVEIDLWAYHPDDGLTRLSHGSGVHGGYRSGGTTLIASRTLDEDGLTVQVHTAGATHAIESLAEKPSLPVPPAPTVLAAGERGIRTAVLLPSWHKPGDRKLPVLLDPYGGPHSQRVLASRGAYLESQWFAEQGFAVVIADGRGTPGRSPEWERAIAGDLASPVLEDQIEALHAAAAAFPDLDTGAVAIRGWSFGGYLSALAVLRRPDVFHAAVVGAPVTDWRLYDTHYTERYLGVVPGENYDRSSLSEQAVVLPHRPLLLIHGLADDNVVVAHTLRLSAALLAAGYPHQVLPLTGITHMASSETVAENLLNLQLDFLRRALGPS
jgi:dipeptidyl-peptidase 4